MPARNPRVNVVLEKPVYDIVGRIAREEGTSLVNGGTWLRGIMFFRRAAVSSSRLLHG